MSLYTPYLNKKLIGTILKQPDGVCWVFPQYVKNDDGSLSPIEGVEEMFPPSGSFMLDQKETAYKDEHGVVRIHLNEEPGDQGTPHRMVLGRQVVVYQILNGLMLCRYCPEASQTIMKAGRIGPMGFKTISLRSWTKHILLQCAGEEELAGPFRYSLEKEKGHTYFRLAPPGMEHPSTYTRRDLLPLKMPAVNSAEPEPCPVSLVAKKATQVSYVGLVARSPQGLILDLQYSLEKDGTLLPLQEQVELQNLPEIKDTHRGIVRLDLHPETAPKLSKFPTPQDAWELGVERLNLDHIREKSGIGPWATANPIPPKGSPLVVVSPSSVYGPVATGGLKSGDQHRYLTIGILETTEEKPSEGFEVVRFKKPGSTQNKEYHLVLVRERQAAEPPQEEQVEAPEETAATPTQKETTAEEAIPEPAPVPPEPEIRPEPLPQNPPIHTDADNQRAIVDRLVNLPPAEASLLFPDYAIPPAEDASGSRDWGLIGIRAAGAVLDIQEALTAADLQMSQLKCLVKDETIALWKYMRSIARDTLAKMKNAFRNIEVHMRGTGEPDSGVIKKAFGGKTEMNWPVLRSVVEALRCQDITYLFEYYCQHRLLEGFLRLGFTPVEDGASTHFNYTTPAVGGQPTARANTIRMQRGKYGLTFYLTPSICGEAGFENGLRLFRRDYDHGSAPSPLTPDFVIKLTSGDRSDYVILDAKFSPSKNIDTGLLDAVIAKYYGHIGVWEPQDAIRMVWTLQGRLNSAQPYHGYTPSPMAEARGGFPSFGNCEVNEQQPDGMRLFWETFRKLLS